MATQTVAFPDDHRNTGDLDVVRKSFNTHDSSDGPQRRNKLRTNNSPSEVVHNCVHDSERIIGIRAAMKIVLDFIPGYDLASTLDQDSQNLEWLFSKENPLGTVRRVRWVQLARAHIQFKLSKSDTVGGQMLPDLWENGQHPIHGVDCATAGMRGQHQMEVF